MYPNTSQVSSPQSLVILVADDDPIFRALIQAKLSKFNCTLLEAADGAEAWNHTRSNTLDLAIVDYDMPGLDGIGLIRCLRGHKATRHIPIIMCTSRQDMAAMHEAIQAGASSFLTKPVQWTMFETHIGHLLHQSQAAAEASATIERLLSGLAHRDACVSELVADLRMVADPKVQSILARFEAAYGKPLAAPASLPTKAFASA